MIQNKRQEMNNNDKNILRRLFMTDFGFNEMLAMQRELQDKYKDKWEQISPEVGQNK